jgi:hypothetical protein
VDTATPIELVWTLLAVVGCTVSAVLVVSAIGDKSALKASKLNGARSVVANSNLRNEAMRMFLQLSFLGIGVRSLLLAPNPSSTDEGSLWVGILFIVIELGLVSFSAFDLRDKHNLYRYFEHEHEHQTEKEEKHTHDVPHAHS